MTKKKENRFQREVIQELKSRFPGCVVMKNATGFHDGFPDIVMYLGRVWAMLECKREKAAKKRPNQLYWVDRMDGMSFARFIYPENRAKVMAELEAFVAASVGIDISGRRDAA